MAKLKKSDIENLELTPEIKADILEIFADIENKESELASLRAKIPTDSQKVVESVDYDKFVAAQNELQKLKDEMQQKIEQSTSHEKSEPFFTAFPSFFE